MYMIKKTEMFSFAGSRSFVGHGQVILIQPAVICSISREQTNIIDDGPRY